MGCVVTVTKYSKIMLSQSSNNKRILENSLFLYVRMVVIMCVNLYAVRLVLNLLGVEDYGINNVVYGIVAMFSFFNGTLATSTQRYFSVALAEGNQEELKKSFSLNLSIFFIFAAIVILLSETIGLWYVNNKMTIPAGRMLAANYIYQLSIIAFVLSLLQVPLNALVIAHEQMAVFAYIGIGEALFKFVVVSALLLPVDKLMVYGTMNLFTTILVFLAYYIFCRRNFPESKYMPYWNTQEAKDIASFSGWHLLGTVSVVVRGQGINLLINAFFNPAINGARAIAVQIDQALNQLSQNFFVAVKPQIYKNYAAKQYEAFIKLIFNSTIICTGLVSLISIPMIINADFILALWLKNVPEYTVVFTQLVLFNSIVDSTSNPSICAALATKRIKQFYMITGTLLILNLPVSYMLLKNGFGPEYTMIVSIVISLIAICARAIILKDLVDLPIWKYALMIFKLALATFIIWRLTLFSVDLYENPWSKVVMSSITSTLLHVILYMLIIPYDYRKRILATINHKLIRI